MLTNNYNFGTHGNEKSANISLLNSQELFAGGNDRDYHENLSPVKEKKSDKGSSKLGFNFNSLANNGDFG